MAVYTEVSPDALAELLTRYNLGHVQSFHGIAEGVENSNYMLTTETGRYILTLFEQRVNASELPWFLGLMEHLAARGITCPLPVHGQDGLALRSLCGKPAAITTFLQGKWPHRINASHCAAVGMELARLHKAGEGYAAERPNGLGPASWAPLLEKCGPRVDQVQTTLRAELQAALADFAHWPSDLPRGHIHADLFPDNVFFHESRLSGVIDFLFAATDFYAYDIAICLNAWCFDAATTPGKFMWNAEKGRALLKAYKAARPLTDAEIDALPMLCQGAAIRFLLTRLYDWLHIPANALVTRKDPLEYLSKLRFHRKMQDGHAYGA